MGEVVEVFDTTLRDGTQREGVSLSAADKMRIAERLEFSSASPSSKAAGPARTRRTRSSSRARARAHVGQRAQIVAFGATRRADVRAADDPSLRALVEAGHERRRDLRQVVDACTSSACCARRAKRTCGMIRRDRRLLRAQGKRVIYDAEHFFDGWRADAEYALETLQAAARGGAETVVLCDNHGGSLPWTIADGARVAHAALGDTRLGNPRARRRRLRRGQHARRGARRRAPRAGHHHNGWASAAATRTCARVIPDLELKLGHALSAGRRALRS